MIRWWTSVLMVVLLSGCVGSRLAPTNNPVEKPGYVLTLQEEFTDFQLNHNFWTTDMCWGNTIANNQERQMYDPENVTVEAGILKLTAKKEQNEGYAFTSGMIYSYPNFSQLYGYFEVRCKMPKGQGLWPAFWMKPVTQYLPEIDVFEYRGQHPDVMVCTYHYHDEDGNHQMTSNKVKGPDFSEDFHTYAVEWTPDELIWYIDNIEVHSTKEYVPQLPHYFLINLAVGGSFLGFPDATTSFPATLEVDYVRVYQKEEYLNSAKN